MMRRDRTAKELAERIDLSYFKRPHPLRTWMRRAILGAGMAAGLWLIVEAIRGSQAVYAPGRVTDAHGMFDQQCSQCHAPAEGEIYGRRVSDQACSKCHDGPPHHSNQTFVPGCASCHVEHRGGTGLTQVSDLHCTRCHTNLQTTGSSWHAPGCLIAGHRIEPQIDAFERRHPEFVVRRSGYQDVARLKLNHQVHLKPELKGLEKLKAGWDVLLKEGRPVLSCTYCHQPDSNRALMLPINYEKNCRACHALHFDARFPGEVVPHEKVDVVVPFVQQKLSEYLMARPEILKQPRLEPVRRLPGKPLYEQLPTTAQAWVDQQVEAAKTLLFRKTCVECHVLDTRSEGLPTIVPPTIPDRWMTHSIFRHQSHRALTCVACHTQVPTSHQTTDVLLPGIQSCRECHSPAGGADFRCTACHIYHDQSKERRLDGALTIQQLK